MLNVRAEQSIPFHDVSKTGMSILHALVEVRDVQQVATMMCRHVPFACQAHSLIWKRWVMWALAHASCWCGSLVSTMLLEHEMKRECSSYPRRSRCIIKFQWLAIDNAHYEYLRACLSTCRWADGISSSNLQLLDLNKVCQLYMTSNVETLYERS